MTETVAYGLTAVALLAVAAMVARTTWVTWRAAMHDTDPPLMHRMFARQGIELSAAENDWTLQRVAGAARRCVTCRDREACRVWLDRGATEGYEAFCPNAAFIKSLQAAQARA